MGTQGVLSLWIIWLVCACNVGVSDGRYTLGVRREGDAAIWATTTWSQQQQPSKRAGIRGVKVKSQASERAALLAFKQTLSSSDALKLASWSAGTDHCDGTWAGIQCLSSRPRRVYLIDLSGLGLQFTLSNLNLAAYPALQVLWLSENVVTGSLDIFAAQGSFGALTELRMQDTGLTGTLPRSLPAKLRKLHLQSNQLSGSLPPQLPVAAPELEVLLLATNNLQGTIPDTWSEFTKLKTISLDNNPSLTGCIPAWAKSALIGSSRPAATANGAAPAVAVANTQMCGLCGSLLCSKATTDTTAGAAAVPAASTVAVLQPQLQPSVAVTAPTTAAAAPNSVTTPAASSGVTQPAAGDAAQAGPAVSAAAAATTLVPPAVAADAPATPPATPPATAAPASTGVAADTTMPAAAAPAAVGSTTIPVPPPLPITLTPTMPAAAAAAATPAAAEVPAVATPQAAAAPAAGAPAIAAAAALPSALPAANTAALPAITPAAPSAGITPAAQAAPAIVPVPGTALVPPQQSTPPTGGAASANGPATPIDPALTVIDGKNRKPTYI